MISVTVIGSGALGKLYGGLFCLAGHQVCFLERSDFALIQKQKYYEIELPRGEVIQIKPQRIEQDYNHLLKSDLILIAIKTTENHLLPQLLPPTLKPGSKILLLQNGIGNEEYLAAFIQNHPLICGVTTTGATRVRPGYVKVNYLGELKLASYSKSEKFASEFIKQQLNAANLAANLCPQIQLFENHRSLRWSKLLWNIPFSSLSILFNTSTEVLATQKPYLKIIRSLMEEISLIAKKEGSEFTANREQLIELTASLPGFYPSMYYDFKEGRGIEAQYIVFNVVDCAEKQSLNIPFLALLKEQLSLLIQKKSWLSPSEQKDLLSRFEHCSNPFSQA